MSGWFGKGLRAVGGGLVNFESTGDDFQLAYLKDTYVVDYAAHQFVSDLGSNIIVRSASFKCTLADFGIIDFADIVTTVTGGFTLSGVLLFQQTGSGVSNDATRRLMILKDAYTVAQLPKVTTGGTFNVTPDNTTWKFAIL